MRTVQQGDLVLVKPTTSGGPGAPVEVSPPMVQGSLGEHQPVNAKDLVSVAGKEGHTASSGAITRRANLEGNVDRDGLKLTAAIEQLAVMLKGRRESSSWAPADLQVRLPINRILAETNDLRTLFPGADGQLRAGEVPLVDALLAGVQVGGMDDHARAVSTNHRYLE